MQDHHDFIEITILRGSNLCGTKIKKLKAIIKQYQSIRSKISIYAVYSCKKLSAIINDDYILREGDTIILRVNPSVYKSNEWEKFIKKIM